MPKGIIALITFIAAMWALVAFVGIHFIVKFW